MKDEDNFNFDDEFESSAEESPKGLEDADDSEVIPGSEFGTEDSEESLDELPQKSSSGLVGFIKSNWLFILLGVAAAGVAGYLTYGILFPAPAPQKPAAAQTEQAQGFGLKPVVPEPTSKPATSPSQPAASATPAQVSTAASANPMPAAAPATITMTQQDMKTLMQGFAKVVNESSQNIYNQMQNLQVLVQDVGQASLAQQKQTAQVAVALNNMQQSMQALAASLNTYNKNMQVIGQQLGRTQQQLALLLAEQSATVQKLTLRAVVPGRAWLVDDQGNTTTVTVGTQLPNYGTVVNIDSGKGEVIMSTGYVFK
ncbi:MAG: hypothetical protein K0R66_584 [Gammaproteobacteria bacterium]|jgi:hypothetical protein|nr:hypothetical protein [Gammaproteobacteria bacterium]